MSDDGRYLEDEAPKAAQQDEPKDEVEGHLHRFKANDDGGDDTEVEAHLHRHFGTDQAPKAL